MREIGEHEPQKAPGRKTVPQVMVVKGNVAGYVSQGAMDKRYQFLYRNLSFYRFAIRIQLAGSEEIGAVL
ncbi:MAG: hypothetical protein WCE63_12780 [Acidobacteriaceae bacterium]